jgi:hypothetical protein
MSWYNNPYFHAYEYKRGYYRDNVFGQVKLDYNIMPRTGPYLKNWYQSILIEQKL